jgi:hypothetical protein
MSARTSLSAVLALTLTASLSAAQAQGRGSATPPTPPPQSHGANAKSTSTPSSHSTPVPVSQRLAQQPQLTANLQKLFPNMDLAAESANFKTLGGFVSALHVSKNLDIPFDQLKAKITGDKAESLGKAIKELKPSANADAEVKKADAQARADQQTKKSGKGE